MLRDGRVHERNSLTCEFPSNNYVNIDNHSFVLAFPIRHSPLSPILFMHALLKFYPAALLYALFVALKLAGTDWGTDLPGMHAGIGAIFLTFGASACHMAFATRIGEPRRAGEVSLTFWVVATLAFLMMFLDSAFGVHERYAGPLGVPEQAFLLSYGVTFLALAGLNLKKVGLPFILFFGGFGLASVGAILGDMSSMHEGLIEYGGKAYSFEQALETLGCLLLACAFASTALRTIKQR